MMNLLTWLTLKRYLSSSRKEWLRFDSVFMFIGIVISVCTLTAALSLFDGYTHALRNSILGANSHIYIYPNENDELTVQDVQNLKALLAQKKEVQAYASLIMKPAMISANGQVKGCVVHGIEWNNEHPTTEYKKYVTEGTYKLQRTNDIVVGTQLCEKFGLSVGDTVQLVRPSLLKGTGFGLIPLSGEYRVVGKYRSGMYEYDDSYVFMDNTSASSFFQLGKNVNMMEVRLKDVYIKDAEQLSQNWGKPFIGKYQFLSWMYFSQSLFSLLVMEKWMIFIILTFLLLIAAFNVVSALLTMILERRKEIGILKTLGAGDNLLRQMFFSKVMLISVGAIILGEATGVLLAELITRQTVIQLKADVYFLDKLSVEFTAINIFLIFGVTILIIVLGTLIPLRRMSKMKVIDILREG